MSKITNIPERNRVLQTFLQGYEDDLLKAEKKGDDLTAILARRGIKEIKRSIRSMNKTNN